MIARAASEKSHEERTLLLLAPMIDFSKGRLVRVAEGRAASSLTDVAEHVAARHNLSARQVMRRFRSYEQGGTAALQHKPYKNRGESKLFGRAPQTIPDNADGLLDSLTPAGRFIAGLHLHDNFSPRACWEALEAKHAEHGLAEAPSYNAVLRWLQSWPQIVRNSARMNLHQWNDRHRPSVRRDYSTIEPMEYGNLDHAQDDFVSYNDFIPMLGCYTFPDFEPNKPLRMWFTGLQLIGPRYMAGYSFSAIPNAESVLSAVRMCVLRTGSIPRVVLTDRGLDFLSTVAECSVQKARIEGSLLRLIRRFHGEQGQAIKAIGRNPQSKPIESWFRFKRERFDSLVYSRCGNAPQNRPDSTQALLDWHEAWRKDGAPGVSPSLPRASETVVRTCDWIENCYHRKHQHSGHGMHRRTPEQVFREGWSLEKENAAKKYLDPRVLEEFLWHRELRAVRDGCCVRIYNALFEPADAESTAALRAWDGHSQKVEIACDPYRLDYAVAYDPETKERLGALVAQRRFAWGEPQENIKAHLRTRGNPRRAVKGIVEQLAPNTTAEQPFAFLEATGTDGVGALIASSPRVLRKRAEGEARKQLASPFVSDAVKEAKKDFWNEER